ncbi:MAG: ATP-binding protein [Chitinispirillia bacterium]|nr:ATP-binding protein [Chitinispirillia bacterium]MCL2268486.1 ATP-binding protein [Chitinispirillia bacterium]
MDIKFPYTIRVKLPSDLEVIPPIRKFISEILLVSGFSAKFAFRSEIIVDAICNNAITHGSGCDAENEIEVSCEVHSDRFEVVVKDRGGSASNIERLKEAVRAGKKGGKGGALAEDYDTSGMGLEIVKLLSETIELSVDENNLTSIHVVRKREDVSPSP